MSTRLITQLNPFSNDRKIEEIENSTVQEIINKIDIHKAVNTGWRVLLNDQVVTDFQQQTNDGDTLYIKIVPEGDATPKDMAVAEKWAGGIATVAGAVLILTGVGSGVGFSLIGAGIGLLINGIATYNTDFSGMETKTPERSPSIRGSRNRARPMEYLPILLGKRRIYADFAANPYTWVDSDGEQYLYQLFCCGQKDIEIDTSTFKLGETKLEEFSQSGSISGILDGSDSWIQMQISQGSSVPDYFSKCIHEEALNEVLRKKIDGQDNYIVSTTPSDTEEINVDIYFYNGLGKYNSDNKIEEATVSVEAYYKLESAPDSDYVLMGYFADETNELKASELKTKRFSVTKTGLAKGKYNVKIVRVTDDHDDDNKIIDDVYVGSIRSLKNIHAVSDARAKQITLIALKLKASAKINSLVEELNFEAQSYLDCYNSDTKTWTRKLSSNPASAAVYAMQGEMSQQKLSDSDINWNSFEKLYSWCEANKYECNEYVYDSISISDLLSSIGSTCRAEIVRQFGKITVIQDIEKDGFTQIFTPRNSWDYQEQILFPSIPDALSLNFTDKESGYALQELKVYNTPTGNRESEPDTIQDVQLWGVTSNEQARKLGMYQYAVTKNRPLVHKFSADFEYLLCQKGDWIKYAGDIALAGITQGRVKEIIYADGKIAGIITDEKLQFEEGKLYSVRIRKNDGTAILKEIVNSGSNTYTAVFTTYEDRDSNINENDLFIFGYSGNDSIDLLVTDIQCSDELTADIIAVEYAPEIFDVDNPDFILPDFENQITDVVYPTDNGVIDQSDWIKFEVYNDSGTMPVKPIGNGQNDGWHATRTENSKWLSSKTAKSIGAGEWSSPVNIDFAGKIDSLYANHTVMLYRELGAGEVPMGDSPEITSNLTYSFATNQISWEDESGANNWSSIIPANPTRPVYVTSATAFGKGESDTIAPNEWAKPMEIGQNGVNGISIASIQLFKRALTEPEKPFISSTYCFNTGDLQWSDPTQSSGWQRNIPPLDEDSSPIWITHATALTTNDSAYSADGKLYDEIDSDEWSKPEQYSANEFMSQAEIENLIKRQINDSSTPYIYAEPQIIGISVNSENYIPINQRFDVKIHVLQFNAELDFILGDLSEVIPDDFTTAWDSASHTLTITGLQAKRIISQNWSIPLFFKELKARWGYKQSGSEARYVNKKYELLADKPADWDDNYQEYFKALNKIPVANTSSTWIPNIYYRAVIECYGSVVYEEDLSEKNVQISVSPQRGGRNLGSVSTLAELQTKTEQWRLQNNGLIIGDYFSWVGTTVASTLSQSGQFQTLTVYCYVGREDYQWTLDNDKGHIASVGPDIISAAMSELELAQANPDVNNYYNKLFASIIIANKIVSNEAFINMLVANQGFIENLGATILTIGAKNGKLGKIISEVFNDDTGFELKQDGTATFKNIIARGAIHATSLTIGPNVNIPSSKVEGLEDLEDAVEAIEDTVEKTVVSVVTYYYNSTTNTAPTTKPTTPPTTETTSGWSVAPIIDSSHYSWSCNYTTYADNTGDWGNIRPFSKLGTLQTYATTASIAGTVTAITPYFYNSTTDSPPRKPTGSPTPTLPAGWSTSPTLNTSTFVWTSSYVECKSGVNNYWTDVKRYSSLGTLQNYPTKSDISANVVEAQKIYWYTDNYKSAPTAPNKWITDSDKPVKEKWQTYKPTASDITKFEYIVFSCTQYLDYNNNVRTTKVGVDSDSIIDTDNGFMRINLIDTDDLFARNITMKGDDSVIQTENFTSGAETGFKFDGKNGKIECNDLVANNGTFENACKFKFGTITPGSNTFFSLAFYYERQRLLVPMKFDSSQYIIQFPFSGTIYVNMDNLNSSISGLKFVAYEWNCHSSEIEYCYSLGETGTKLAEILPGSNYLFTILKNRSYLFGFTKGNSYGVASCTLFFKSNQESEGFQMSLVNGILTTTVRPPENILDLN